MTKLSRRELLEELLRLYSNAHYPKENEKYIKAKLRLIEDLLIEIYLLEDDDGDS